MVVGLGVYSPGRGRVQAKVLCLLHHSQGHGDVIGTAAFLPSSIPRPSIIVAKTSAADVNSGTVFPK